MRSAVPLMVVALAALSAGCMDSTSPRDVTPPAAPRGLYSVTGDGQVTLHWLANTESDVAGYRVYEAPCASGSSCPYDRVGSTSATSVVVTGLANGVTRYFAVAAVDRSGNESALSYETVFDTPRPEGFGESLANYVSVPATAGWDFSTAANVAWDDVNADVFYGDNGSVKQIFTEDTATDIQDAGYATSLDAVDFAPNAGWSPTGSAEAIVGHCYVVWTRDNHYAKFRITGFTNGKAVFDWAYQTDPGNPELAARRARLEGTPQRRPIVWLRPA